MWLHKVSRITSYALHPALMPMLALYSILALPLSMQSYVPGIIRMMYLLTAICTVLIPLTMLFLYTGINKISSIEVNNKKLTQIYLLSVAVGLYINYYIISRIPVNLPAELAYFLIIATIFTMLLVAIIQYYNISLHMVGVGALTGLLLALGVRNALNTSGLISVVVVFASILASSLLILDKNKPNELVIGYLSGFFIFFAPLIISQ